jgi:hypothetical protein
MIEESEDFYNLEEKFLVVLDSAIPTLISTTNTSIEQSTINKSDVVFDLQVPIQKSLEDIQLKCSVKSAVFPNSQYLINSTNSYYGIALLDVSANPVITGILNFDIPKGNYNTESLRTTLQELIFTGLNNRGFTDVIFYVSYDPVKCSYIFEMETDNVNISQFYISFQPSDIGTRRSVSQLGTVLGFFNDFIYYSGPLVDSKNTQGNLFSNVNKVVSAPYPSNLSGLRSINVIMQNVNTNSITVRPFFSFLGYSNSIVNSNYNNALLSQFFRNNIICNIVCNANPMEYIFYEKQSDFFIDLKEPTLGRIHILLTDIYGNLLELNNQDWTITLEFTLLKKKEFKTKSFYEYLSRS